MLRHAAASAIIEYAYNDKAVLAQRLMLTEELYGNTYTVCKVHRHICKQTHWTTAAYLNMLINIFAFYTHFSHYSQSSVCNTIEKVAEANPDKLSNIIDEMKQILTPMAQK